MNMASWAFFISGVILVVSLPVPTRRNFPSGVKFLSLHSLDSTRGQKTDFSPVKNAAKADLSHSRMKLLEKSKLRSREVPELWRFLGQKLKTALSKLNHSVPWKFTAENTGSAYQGSTTHSPFQQRAEKFLAFFNTKLEPEGRSLRPDDSRTSTSHPLYDEELMSRALCSHIEGYETQDYIPVVYACPMGFRNDTLRWNCARMKTLNISSVETPVQDSNGVVYRNRFCAECNGVQNYLEWRIRWVCDGANMAELLAGTLSNNGMSDFFSNMEKTCTRTLVPRLPHLIRTMTMEECRMYSRRGPLHGVLEEGQGSHSNIYPVSFNVIMNFDYSGKTHLLFATGYQEEEGVTIQRCPVGQIYDPYDDQCRTVVCGEAYTMGASGCVPRGAGSETPHRQPERVTDLSQLANSSDIEKVDLEFDISPDQAEWIQMESLRDYIRHELADKLNISVTRIPLRDFNITLVDSATSGNPVINVQKVSPEEYNQMKVGTPDQGTEESKSLRARPLDGRTTESSEQLFQSTEATAGVSQSTEGNTDTRQSTETNTVESQSIQPTAKTRETHSSVNEVTDDPLRTVTETTDSIQELSQTAQRGDLLGTAEQRLRQNTRHPNGLVSSTQFPYQPDPYTQAPSFAEDRSTETPSPVEDRHRSTVEPTLADNVTPSPLFPSLPTSKSDEDQRVRITFIIMPPPYVNSGEQKSGVVVQALNSLVTTGQFSLTLNGSSISVDSIENEESYHIPCNYGRLDFVVDDLKVETRLNPETGRNETMLLVTSTGKLYPVGRFDYTEAWEAETNTMGITDVLKYAWVCDMPHIARSDCGRIRLSRPEYMFDPIANKIHFQNRTYSFDEYEVMDDSTGDVEICVPESYTENMVVSPARRVPVKNCITDYDKVLKAEGYLTAVLGRISIVALATVLLTYIFFPALRNLPGVNTMNLTLALFLAEVIFITGEEEQTRWLCSFVAASLHYCFLAAHCWMNVMSFDVYRTFAASSCILTRVRDKKKYLPRYALYAWGMPLVVVGVCLFIDFSGVFDGVRIGYGGTWSGGYPMTFENTTNLTQGNHWAGSGDDEVSSVDPFNPNVPSEGGHIGAKGLNDTEQIGDDGLSSDEDDANSTKHSSKSFNDRSFSCWIQNPLAALFAFGAPILLIFLVNCILFGRTIISIRRTTSFRKNRDGETRIRNLSGRSDVILYIKMSSVMGFTWVFGLASSIISAVVKEPSDAECIVLHTLGILFPILNCSQGLFIFVAFVCNRRVFGYYKAMVIRIKNSLLKRKTKNVISRLIRNRSTVYHISTPETKRTA